MKAVIVLAQNTQADATATPAAASASALLPLTKLSKEAAPRWLLVLAFAAIYLVWGSTYVAIRFVVESLPPFVMAGARFLIAGGVLLAIMRLRDRTPITPRHWRSAAWSGGLMLVGGNGLVCWAEQYVSSGLAALLIATVPIWFAIFECTVFGGPRPTAGVIAGLLLGMVGIYVLIGPATIRGEPIHLPGAIALLGACVFWSFGSLLSRRVELPKSPFVTAAMQMICAGVAMTLIGVGLGEGARVHLDAFTPKAVWSLAYLIVFGSLIALSAYVWLLGVTSPARVATYAYVNPVVALLLGAALANEPITSRALVAMCLIVSAVALITTFARRSSATAIPEEKS